MSFGGIEKPVRIGDDEKLDDQAVIGLYEDVTSDVLIDARAERALVRKLDLRILPILCLMYLAACEYLSNDWSPALSNKRRRSGPKQHWKCTNHASKHRRSVGRRSHWRTFQLDQYVHDTRYSETLTTDTSRHSIHFLLLLRT